MKKFKRPNPEWVKVKHWLWELLASGTLSHTETRILGAIGSRFKHSNYRPAFSLTHEQVARDLGIKRPNVSTAFKGLEAKDVIIKVSRGVYRLSTAIAEVGYGQEDTPKIKRDSDRGEQNTIIPPTSDESPEPVSHKTQRKLLHLPKVKTPTRRADRPVS